MIVEGVCEKSKFENLGLKGFKGLIEEGSERVSDSRGWDREKERVSERDRHRERVREIEVRKLGFSISMVAREGENGRECVWEKSKFEISRVQWKRELGGWELFVPQRVRVREIEIWCSGFQGSNARGRERVGDMGLRSENESKGKIKNWGLRFQESERYWVR